MHTKAVYQGAKGLTRIGCAVLRFNFRGVGAAKARSTKARAKWRTFARPWISWRRVSRRPAVGGRVLVRIVDRARDRRRDPRVSVLIGIAPPVNRDGYTWDRTLATEKPKFFVQGDLDELCPLKDMWAFYAS